jgi:hypothetical protein
MKTRLRLFAHVLLGGLLSLALGACAAPAAQPAESTHSAATEAPVSPTFAPQGTPPGFPTVVIDSVVTDPLVIALLAGLRQRGFPAQLEDASRVELLQDAPGQGYAIGNGSLYIHMYADAQAAEARAASLPNAFEHALFDWRAPPHFFQCDRLIVLYVGADEGVVSAISQFCAPPFYTASISVGGPAIPTLVPTAPATPASGYPLEIQRTFSTGLTVDEYALAGEPTLGPLNFTPLHLTRADIDARTGKYVEGFSYR